LDYSTPSQPSPKGKELIKKNLKVLSFGEDLGEVINVTTTEKKSQKRGNQTDGAGNAHKCG
jgi:hypothetical protein